MIAMSHQDFAITLLVANECLASVINEVNGLPTRNCIQDKVLFFLFEIMLSIFSTELLHGCHLIVTYIIIYNESDML